MILASFTSLSVEIFILIMINLRKIVMVSYLVGRLPGDGGRLWPAETLFYVVER